MALILWEPWRLVLRTGFNLEEWPAPTGRGAWLLLKLGRKLVMSPTSWGSALGSKLLFFHGGRHYMITTHNDRFCCCCCVLCGAGPSKGSQRCLPTHPHWGHTGTGPWLGFNRKELLNSRLWLTQKWVWGPREEWILYSGEVQAVQGVDRSTKP